MLCCGTLEALQNRLPFDTKIACKTELAGKCVAAAVNDERFELEVQPSSRSRRTGFYVLLQIKLQTVLCTTNAGGRATVRVVEYDYTGSVVRVGSCTSVMCTKNVTIDKREKHSFVISLIF